MHPVAQGDISSNMLMSAFLRSGFVVLKPITELSRYDLVIDRGNGFERVQCKTGRLRKGAIIFNACSHNRGQKGQAHYRGQIDLFGIYCPDNGQYYLVPVNDVGLSRASIRVAPTKNSQKRGIRDAAKYLFQVTPE